MNDNLTLVLDTVTKGNVSIDVNTDGGEKEEKLQPKLD